MTDKLPTIDIHGKEYVQVKDRISYFNEKYPNGSIKTSMLSQSDADMVVMIAKVTPDMDKPERYFSGHSQARWADKSSFVNATSAMENAETSAVGRALAMMGIGIIESVSSADEVKKSVQSQSTASDEPFTREPVANPDTCDHPDFWVNTVKKEGPNKGKEFKSCKKCKSFLGFMPTQPVKEEKEEEPLPEEDNDPDWIKG